MKTDAGTCLESWKEIAAYLGRGVRACQHWEQELGLPVHRLEGSPKARVYAYTGELDAWRGQREGKPPRRSRWPAWPAVSVAALVVLAAMAVLLWRPQAARRGDSPARAVKRLVVLPFENLGPPEDDYFADGLADEITARITSVRELEVIGRASALRYRKTDKSLQKIGEELGADYVLSGTVRWERPAGGTGRVRVTPSLVRASDGRQLWARMYDDRIVEVFRLQSDIAVRVSKALRIALKRPELAELASRPTLNPAAHDLYLRGREAIRRGIQNRENLAASIAMFEKAVQEDPQYVDAYAGLAHSHASMFWWFDHTEQRAERARVAAEMAIRLGPETEAAHLALGQYYYLCRLDYDRAAAELRLALAKQPRNSDTLSFMAYVKRRQGRLKETAAYLLAALRVDPLDAELWANLGDTYQLMGDYPESERRYRRAAALLPNVMTAQISPNGSLAVLYLYGWGDSSKLRAVLEALVSKAKSPDEATWLQYFWTLIDVREGKYQDALGHIALMPQGAVDSEFEFVLKEMLQAQVYGLVGDRRRERDRYHEAQIILSHRVDEKPEDPRFHSALGIAYAGLGLKDEAVGEAARAVELLPVSREFWRGIFLLRDQARVDAMVGDPDKALERLEHLLSLSGEFSAAWLKADPAWASLRSRPRFSALLRQVE